MVVGPVVLCRGLVPRREAAKKCGRLSYWDEGQVLVIAGRSSHRESGLGTQWPTADVSRRGFGIYVFGDRYIGGGAGQSARAFVFTLGFPYVRRYGGRYYWQVS